MSDCFTRTRYTPTAPTVLINPDTGLIDLSDRLVELIEYVYQRTIFEIRPPDEFELTGEICMEDTEFPYILANDLKVYSLPSYVGLRLVCRKKKMFAGYKFVLFGERQLIRPGDWYENQDGGMSKSSSIFKVPGSAKIFRRETLYEPQED